MYNFFLNNGGNLCSFCDWQFFVWGFNYLESHHEKYLTLSGPLLIVWNSITTGTPFTTCKPSPKNSVGPKQTPRATLPKLLSDVSYPQTSGAVFHCTTIIPQYLLDWAGSRVFV